MHVGKVEEKVLFSHFRCVKSTKIFKVLNCQFFGSLDVEKNSKKGTSAPPPLRRCWLIWRRIYNCAIYMTYFHIAKLEIFSFCSANSMFVCFDANLRKMTQNRSFAASSDSHRYYLRRKYNRDFSTGIFKNSGMWVMSVITGYSRYKYYRL